MSNDKVFLTEEVKKRWEPVIQSEDYEFKTRDDGSQESRTFAPIEDKATERMVNIVLENMLNEAPTNGTNDVIHDPTGGGADYATNGRIDPVLIKLVRRAMPALIANDLVGVQPMTGPTGLIFALRSYYGTDPATRTEAFQPGVEADKYYSGNKDMGAGTDDGILTTPEGEQLGQGLQTDSTSVSTTEPVTQTNPWNEMSFSIEKSSVTAETRALKARYTTELAQDLRVTHGLDAATELSNILSTEIITEQNREIVNLIYSKATTGAQSTAVDGVDVAGTFNLGSADLDTRWAVESYKMLLMMIVREANIVAQTTGRGAANRLIVSPVVANALDMVAQLSNEAPNGISNLQNTSGVGVTYAGTLLGGRFRVYVDQYASDQVVMGYKGSNVYDAGMYYCPYVPLQMMKAMGEEDFQPRIGFKTRYGIADNPFGAGAYYRSFAVSGI
jgi:hypothetical protein